MVEGERSARRIDEECLLYWNEGGTDGGKGIEGKIRNMGMRDDGEEDQEKK